MITEAIAKITLPVSQLVLARLLAPEVFGVLAIVIMVASFAEMLADAGFQKYLIQHEFPDKRSLYRAANVAFWSSMAISLVLLLLIVLLRDQLATLVGNPGLGVPIAIASLSLPMSVVVSTQNALFRRAFVYRALLPIRVGVGLIPLVVSVPLAIYGMDYWSLIVGVLAAHLVNAVAMTWVSPWNPRLYFSFGILRRMFGFSAWTLLEAISIWATMWAGTFVVGTILSPHELGLYRQPMLVVTSAFAVITSATTPILFAALSRLQNDPDAYRKFFFRFQFLVSLVVFPAGVGAFFYRDFFTDLLFGPDWAEASLMFGAWALSTSSSIVLSHYCSEIFRSLGKPRISLLSQCLYMMIMIPAIYFAALDGFATLVIVNALVRLVAIAISQWMVFLIAGFGFIRVLRNLYAPLICAGVMGVAAAWFAHLSEGHWGFSTLGIVGCSVLYVLVCLCFPDTRTVILDAGATVLRRGRQERKSGTL
nr:oligosaccharide flippase family protein [Nesterenkonia sp. YGD6]